MKSAIIAGLAVFLFLFALTTFPQSSASREAALQTEFTPEEIDLGQRLSLQRKLIFWTSTFLSLGFFTWLVFSGKARQLTDRLDRWGGGRWWLTLLLLALVCFLAERLLLFPLRVVSLENWRVWGMTNQTFLEWLTDYAKMTAVEAVVGGLLLLGLYVCLRRFPRSWWLWAAGGTVAAAVALAFLLPVWIAPLFNTFTPLEDSDLNQRIQTLAEKAGVPVKEVLVVDASRQGNHTNAYFTGFGSTRRIVLYDTLLKSHPADEIESILGHEIGHWKHHHILIGIALGSVGALVGFFLLSRILCWAVSRPPFYLKSPADPAGWPLILLLTLVGSWLVLPVQNAVSRHFERQADWTALELAGKADAFVDAERRLARDNKSNVAPAPFSVWLFSTHPPTVERIEMAKQWQAQQRAVEN